MVIVKLQAVGNSTGVVLPKELLDRLGVGPGDSLYAVEMPQGVLLTPHDSQTARQMEVAETVMREDRDVLKKLAE